MPKVNRLASVTAISLAGVASFLMQPLVARQLLSDGSGSAYTWITVTCAFQAALVLGYLLGGVLARTRGKWTAVLMLAPVAGPLVVLPPTDLSDPWNTVIRMAPTLIPFVALTSIPVSLAARLGTTGSVHRPYRLAALSSLGSLLGLGLGVASGEVIPLSGARLFWWAIATVAVALTALSAWSLGPAPRIRVVVDRAAPPAWMTSWDNRQALAWVRYLAAAATPAPLHWLVLSALAGATLASFTAWVSDRTLLTPFVWTAPLALYLLVFAGAFAITRRRGSVSVALAGALLLGAGVTGATRDVAVRDLPLLLLLLGTALWAVLTTLERSKPEPGLLPRFWVWVAAGGALGAAFSLLCITVLDAPWEFAGLVTASLCLLPAPGWPRPWRYAPALVGVLIGGFLLLNLTNADLWTGLPGLALLTGAAVVAVLAVGQARPLALAAAIAVTAVAAAWIPTMPELQLIERGRSPFGSWQVAQYPGAFTALVHHTITHGEQQSEGPGRLRPGAYYAAGTGLGDAMRVLADSAAWPELNAAVVGLGTGASAAWSAPGQHWTFYDVDADMIDVAGRHFTYLADAQGTISVELNDGLAGVRAQPDGALDVIILDAYLGDTTPAHLLTDAAFTTYARKLRPGGVILTHTSNRYLDIGAVVNGAAHASGLTTLTRTTPYQEGTQLEPPSYEASWAASTTNPELLSALRAQGWEAPRSSVTWTEELAPLLPVWK